MMIRSSIRIATTATVSLPRIAASSSLLNRSWGITTSSSGPTAASPRRSSAHHLPQQSYRCFSSTSATPSTSNSTKLYTWGTDTHGSLLQNSKETCLWEPTVAPIDDIVSKSPIQSVVCGPTDTMVLLESGDVYVAGKNGSGQLGLGHSNPVPTLTHVPGLPPLEKVALGPSSGAFLSRDDGDVYSCGFGGSLVSGLGALGHGNGESYMTPKRVDSLVEDGCRAIQVVLGESNMTVLTSEGEILTTGASNYGRLGNGETSVDNLYLEPVEILQSAVSIEGGKSFTLAIGGSPTKNSGSAGGVDDGVVYGWGRNHKGQLGTGFGMAVDMYSMEDVPQPIDSDELINRKVTKIAAGQNHAACITSSGELFWWGSALYLEPVRVPEVLHVTIVDVVCGNDYTMALSEEGQVYVWGKGKTGVLGLGSSIKTSNQAQRIIHQHEDGSGLHYEGNQKVVALSAGWSHAACLVEDEGE